MNRTRGAYWIAIGLTVPCCAGAPIWRPGPVGTDLVDFVHNTDSHRTIVWAEHAGFDIAVDNAGVYDNWTGVDKAPAVRIPTAAAVLDVRDSNFVLTTRLELTPGYGTRFHAGLAVFFDVDDVLVFGPHGSTDLVMRRPSHGTVTQPYASNTVWLKLKRDANIYTAWYSADGVDWNEAGSIAVVATDVPLSVGTMLKTWTVPHAEAVRFRHFEVAHVTNEPAVYSFNTIYGLTDASAMRFVYGLSGLEILFRLYIHNVPGGGNPFDNKLYVIHGANTIDSDGDGDVDAYEATRVFGRTVLAISGLYGSGAYTQRNALLVAPIFPLGSHPYPDRASFGYQTLRGEEDHILLDFHEDYVREMFPSSAPGTDDSFSLLGHSGGGQFSSRFLMLHGNKLRRAAISSPATTALPTNEFVWPRGTTIYSNYLDNNPRMSVDLAAAHDTPVAMIVGENDNLIGRGSETSHYPVWVVTYSRHDECRKFTRMMYQNSGQASDIACSIVPESGHEYEPNKQVACLKYLFGDAAERAELENWRYALTINFQDGERMVIPADVDKDRLYFSKFTRFDRPPLTSAVRYEFRHGTNLCDVSNHQGDYQYTTTYSLTHNASTLEVDVEGETYSTPTIVYGKLRLYGTDGLLMLEESPVVTPHFIDQEIRGRQLFMYTCTGRDAAGPVAGPSPQWIVQLGYGGGVDLLDFETGQPVIEPNMTTWRYDNERHLLYFTDGAVIPTYHDIRFGEWRWGTDEFGRSFLAALRTRDDNAPPRIELQTNRSYNPRYFEEWEVASLDFDGDGRTDVADNCPVVANPGQLDYDQDGAGNECDPAPLRAPANVRADDGDHVGFLHVVWDAVPAATHYRVYRTDPDDPGNTTPVTDWQIAGFASDSPPVPGKDYLYHVTAAIDASGTWEGHPSAQDVGWAALAPPQNVQATDRTRTNDVLITWNAVAGATHYRAFWSSDDDPDGASPVSGWTTAGFAYDITAPPGHTYYYFVVAAVDAAGNHASAFSSGDEGTRALDCNQNAVPDWEDIATGAFDDCNQTDVPDVCETIAESDFNADGRVNLADFKAFVDSTTGPGTPFVHPDEECSVVYLAAFDADGDSDLDLHDFAVFARHYDGP